MSSASNKRVRAAAQGVDLHILFICTGNICRSPMAERLAIAYAAHRALPSFTASSAGVRAVVGQPIHPVTSRVLQRLGGDPSDFEARQLTPRIASSADLILTMTRAQRDAVLELAPRQLSRTFTLSGAARLVADFDARNVDDLAALRPQLRTSELLDIADPIGRTEEFHATVGSQIAELLPPILNLCLSEQSS
ncbi:low molecular weight phosphatase family protein [Mycolicibacterium elephantis]